MRERSRALRALPMVEGQAFGARIPLFVGRLRALWSEDLLIGRLRALWSEGLLIGPLRAQGSAGLLIGPLGALWSAGLRTRLFSRS